MNSSRRIVRQFTLVVLPFLALLVTNLLLPRQGTAQSTPRLGQQVVLVTGSTGGLGREVALRMGSRGAHVIVHGRNRQRGVEVVSEIEATAAGSARFYQADFASFSEVREFAQAVLRDYGRLDILVNNAGCRGAYAGTARPRYRSGDCRERDTVVVFP